MKELVRGQWEFEGEDMSFSISTMWRALEILHDQGQDSFKRYCKACKMSRQDVNRIIGKFNQAYTIKDVQKVMAQ